MFEILVDASLKSCLEFIIKVDELKKILRKTSVIKNDRQENTAEHSWHLCLMAIVLQSYANTPIKLDRVIKMLVVHDLGEIETGDHHLYDSARSKAQNFERSCVEELFASLPHELGDELMSLWEEFRDGKTPEACYAQALDRFQPFLSNLANEGDTWKSLKITKEMAFAKNKHIAEGSQILWETYQALAEQADEKRYFHK